MPNAMMSDMGDPVWTTEIECVDDLCALYEGTAVQIVPASGDRLSGRLASFRLPESSLTIARFDGAFRTRGAQSGDVSIGLQIGVHGRVSQWNLDLEPGDVVVFPPGVERDGTAAGQAEFATATLSVETFNRLVRPGLPERDADVLHRPRRYRAPRPLRAQMVRELAKLVRSLQSVPFAAHAVNSRAFEREALLPFLVGIANDASETDRHSTGADASLVRRVEDWVDQRRSDQLNMLDVSAALGVPVRTLQRSFSTLLGIGPAQYLRQRRLARARNALIAQGLNDTSVTDVAMAHGFWDLSRFAVAYKKIYGESPSETLRAASRSRPIAPVAKCLL